jgi:FkbH-like protein
VSHSFLETLGWLPRPAQDFKERLKGLASHTAPGREARALAMHGLNGNQLHRLASVLKRLRTEGKDLSPLTPFKLGLIGNGTLDFIEPALIASAARHGIALECVRAAYGQVMQEALDPTSILNAARPDAVLIALDHRALDLKCTLGDVVGAQQAVDAAVRQLNTLREGFARNTGALTIFQSLATPAEGLFGSFDAVMPGTERSLITDINRALAELVRRESANALLFDVAGLAERVGTANWFSSAQWNMAKLPFSDGFVPLYADHAARILAALRGKTRRCLVLDLDNTLWGGIIGDDGLEGIRIAQGDPVGEAFLSIQRLALSLRDNGIALVVSSKNEDVTARLPFRKHPEMLLREEHFAVFQANWKDKASNIAAIAQTLNLGLDAFVFLDDSPVERELVRRTLPDVAVPELPEDPALYTLALTAGGYFEATRLSEDDRRRAAFFEGNARRVALQAEIADLDSYLASLNMEITFEPFDDVGRTRIAQLISKSNQFNLTTHRYSEAEVGRLAADPEVFTLQVRLTDTVGDNGMISVIVCRKDAQDTWTIDTWLMSCRVLGRRVEQMVLREIGRHAALVGVRRLIGEYLPTDRNMMVKDLYGKLGFTQILEEQNGATRWELQLPVDIKAAPMHIVRRGFANPAAIAAD